MIVVSWFDPLSFALGVVLAVAFQYGLLPWLRDVGYLRRDGR